MNGVLWHNPRCSTSRKALDLLQAHGVALQLWLYLDQPPNRAELATVAAQLPGGIQQLVRWKEAEAVALQGASTDQILDALVTNPRLIERPVFLTNRGARVGRPPEAVLEIVSI